MYTKKAVSVVASLALAKQALGFNAHRHMHADKRDLKVDIVTHWVTVTVIEGQSVPASTPTPTPAPQPEVPEVQYTPTTTSTSIVVVPTPTPIIAAPSTTLLTSVAPKASSSQPPVVEQAKVVAASVSSTTGGKRGVAYNDATKVNPFFSGSCKECSWAYNWDSSDNGLSASGVDFVPMLWGPIDIHTARWTQNADASIAKGSTHILSFNECDMPSQCNLDAGSAAAAHIKYVNPYAGKVKIGAPAITNSNIAGQGLDWLKSWVSACDTAGCSYDFCVTHWYSPSDAASTLFDHIKSVHEICNGKPVWLTEFAPFGTAEQITSFVQTNIPKLDSLEYLERYSYFMASDGVLNSGSGLSALGQAYASA
ncbi:F5 8 type c domain protein [Colletotrichum higginsianum IMI 349063]|uniref:F5 8 type c domain protein n=4 Tax=Colletotrichum higginsianum TaxID=80884 RepID=A0A1B7XV25_COLHI|nr:F5 8 type c domain protein [Colletotrichum higginsianum IMI 349063]OBR03611.1 F5 8 type c domain protein [Colletotrichum higginsianum IMI 349063]TIC97904.1 Alkali-sensitive linkage protein 1 [Colletotrichum higginsianum]GJD02044.1 F5 8 type c domain protein [Colletotrichum higginsianum]